MTTTQDIIDLIRAQPGIRSVEIEERLETTAISSKLAHRIAAGDIRAERVQAPNGRWVNAYYPGTGSADASPAENDGGPSWGEHRKRHQQRAGTLVAALYTNGDLVIELGRKSLRLTAQETRDLITYLDRVNVDQIIPPAVHRHTSE
ncbi:Uncharacterised protein [Bordetella ansorpii]|uniref:Uncharacterized protein n=1 Tax=Bordetella ansorpii TaxID=288768 RepID=A0A157SVY4_9BORD|nr:hypothetical protein [Bordetella ansorpii]SAI74599.1 Uncharacterised protein [Bordetella ansorpii]